jgi:glutathione S-transferase
VDLTEKAEWHVKQNGGSLPVMELPSGLLIHDSAHIMNYAIDSTPGNQGVALYPHHKAPAGDLDACAATVKQKLNQSKLDKFMGLFGKGYKSRFEDDEAN